MDDNWKEAKFEPVRGSTCRKQSGRVYGVHPGVRQRTTFSPKVKVNLPFQLTPGCMFKDCRHVYGLCLNPTHA